MTDDANSLTSRATRPAVDGPHVSVVQFRALINALGELGYDVGRILAELDLTRSTLEEPDALIPCALNDALFGCAFRQRPMPNLYARLAMATPVGAFPLLDYLIVTCDTVGDGVKQLARYLPLINVPCALDLREDEDPIRIVYVTNGSALPGALEYGVALVLNHLRTETEGAAAADFVSFAHRVDDQPALEQILKCPVRAESSWTGLALSPGAWQVPFRRRDPILRQVLERHAETAGPVEPPADGFTVDVRRELASGLARGTTDVENVARRLGVSARTLQRRLAFAGQSYQELLDTVRRETAEKCIASSVLPVSEVAYLVGYSEPAAFHRAFKRWTGVTPQAFREQHRRRPIQ
jgi:AraC-like DNA-binding protein